MEEVDIYSAFGNILGNVLTATEKFKDPKKKLVSLALERKGMLVNIHVVN